MLFCGQEKKRAEYKKQRAGRTTVAAALYLNIYPAVTIG